MKNMSKRMIHSTIWASEQVSRLSREARLLFIGLITLGDDDGRLKGNPSLIRSQVFPYEDDVKTSDVEAWLKEIEGQNLVARYEIGNEVYYFHPKWETYQNIREDRRKESSIPAPDFEFAESTAKTKGKTKKQPKGNQMSTKSQRSIVKDSIVKDSKDNSDKEKAFHVFWDAYPRKTAKKAAWKAWEKIKWTPELHQGIMDGLSRARESEQWQKDKGRFIPHPATWLNGERWEDEMEPGQKKSKKYGNVSKNA